MALLRTLWMALPSLCLLVYSSEGTHSIYLPIYLYTSTSISLYTSISLTCNLFFSDFKGLFKVGPFSARAHTLTLTLTLTHTHTRDERMGYYFIRNRIANASSVHHPSAPMFFETAPARHPPVVFSLLYRLMPMALFFCQNK